MGWLGLVFSGQAQARIGRVEAIEDCRGEGGVTQEEVELGEFRQAIDLAGMPWVAATASTRSSTRAWW